MGTEQKMHKDEGAPAAGPVSRRAVAKGAAWTVPALMATASAVAVAGSPGHPDTEVTSATGCKPRTEGDNSKDYYMDVCISNDDAHSVILSGSAVMILDGTAAMPVQSIDPPMPFTLASGASQCFTIHATHTNAARGSLSYTITATDTATGDQTTLPAAVAKADVGVC